MEWVWKYVRTNFTQIKQSVARILGPQAGIETTTGETTVCWNTITASFQRCLLAPASKVAVEDSNLDR